MKDKYNLVNMKFWWIYFANNKLYGKTHKPWLSVPWKVASEIVHRNY